MKQVKYMHFNSACSFTALAFILAEKGIMTEDTEIVREAGLPWIFAREGDSFLAGPMLQGKKWYDLYLNPRGLCMREEPVEREKLPEYLRDHEGSMLGLRLPGHRGKHAVVMEEYDGAWCFFNPTREGSGQETEIRLDREGLMLAADPVTIVGTVAEHDRVIPDQRKLTEESLAVLEENYRTAESFCGKPHSREEYDTAMDKIFRPLLLDGITMLELIGETELAEGFRKEQRAFLTFMKGDRTGKLDETVSLNNLRRLKERYGELVAARRNKSNEK